MNPVAVPFLLAELCLAVNVILWTFYARHVSGAITALILMFVTWRLFKWSRA